jgi:hypothetical protein
MFAPERTLAELPTEARVAHFEESARGLADAAARLERFSQWVTDWEFREYSYHL